MNLRIILLVSLLFTTGCQKESSLSSTVDNTGHELSLNLEDYKRYSIPLYRPTAPIKTDLNKNDGLSEITLLAKDTPESNYWKLHTLILKESEILVKTYHETESFYHRASELSTRDFSTQILASYDLDQNGKIDVITSQGVLINPDNNNNSHKWIPYELSNNLSDKAKLSSSVVL